MSDINVSGHVAAEVLVSLNGKSYVVSKPQIRDAVSLVQWLKDREIQQAKRHLQGLEPELAKVVLNDALAEAKKIELGTEAFNAKGESVEAVAYMFWLMVRRNHPEVTYEVALDIIEANAAEVAEKLGGSISLAFGGNHTPPPTTAAATGAAGQTNP